MGRRAVGVWESASDVAVVFAYDYFSPMGPMLISLLWKAFHCLPKRHLGNVGILYCLAAEGTGQAALACGKAVRPWGWTGPPALGLSSPYLEEWL